jgi:hypothetical protein
MDTLALHRALQDANEARAHLYVDFLRAMERRWGRETAIDVMREAIRAWGRRQSTGLKGRMPNDFAGLMRDFIYAPDGGRMFQPEVGRCDSHGIDAQMMTCPLKQAWQAAGLDDAETALMCDIASEADRGAMEAAGFKVDVETWKPGEKGCCLLRIRPA